MTDRPSPSDLLAGRQVALAYCAVVLAVAAALQAFPPDRRTELVLAVSTDPDGLLQHPLRSLLLSPFVVPSLSGLWLLPGAVVAVAAVQRRYGMLRAALVVLLGHAAVSAAVAVLLEGDDDAPQTAAAADVGVSYVLAVAAGLAAGRLRRPYAVPAAVAGTVLVGGLLVAGRTSTDAGHLLAWLTGLSVAVAASRRRSAPCST